MQQMQTQMAQLQTKLNNDNKNGGNNNNTSVGNKNNNVPFWRQLYFWTQGACNHQGSHCCSKVEGHKDNSTFNTQLKWRYHICYPRDKNNNSWRCGKDSELIDKDKINIHIYLSLFLL